MINLEKAPEDVREIIEAIDKMHELAVFIRGKREMVMQKQSYYERMVSDIYHHIELTDQNAAGLVKDAAQLKRALQMLRYYSTLIGYLNAFVDKHKPDGSYERFKLNQKEKRAYKTNVYRIEDFARKSA